MEHKEIYFKIGDMVKHKTDYLYRRLGYGIVLGEKHCLVSGREINVISILWVSQTRAEYYLPDEIRIVSKTQAKE